jgi:hypothetical protein
MSKFDTLGQTADADPCSRCDLDRLSKPRRTP